jgi:hypothetical protein
MEVPMRAKSFLPVLVAALLVLPAIGIVNAQETAAPAITEQADQSIDLTAVDQTATEVQVSNDALEAFVEAEGISDICGACSRDGCAGLYRGTVCGYRMWCIPVNTTFCSDTYDWDCRCARYYN